MEIREPYGCFLTSSATDEMTHGHFKFLLKEYGPVISFLIIQILFYTWFGAYFS
jgi:hypothetical protein